MKRTVYLIRHAEAANKQLIQTDLERPLTFTGQQHAELAGIFLKNQNVNFDLLLCSPAVRTQTTAKLIVDSMSITPPEILITPLIYHATENDLLNILLKAPNSKKNIALVGHNPTISAFGKMLTTVNIENFSPCTIASFQFEVEKWSDLRLQTGHLAFLHFPSIF